MRTRVFSLCLLLAGALAQAQTGVVCTASSVPPLVHAEGVAERVGDIVLECTGAPSALVGGNFSVSLNVNVTNKLAADNVTLPAATGPVLTIENGGPQPAVLPADARLSGANRIDFNGVTFSLSNAGRATVRFSGIRGNVTQIATSFTVIPVTAFVGFTGTHQVAITNNVFSVGVPATGLFGTVLSSLLCSQVGSPLPEVMTLERLLAQGTSFATARVSEGFATSFHPREAGADNGVRIVLRYGGLPSSARLFVPDAVAGSSALQPTSAGDFGSPAAAGQYAAGGNGSLLLVRVRGTDANGAGGSPVWSGAGALPFGRFAEVDLANGAGLAVYEVLDASPSVRESAHITTFLGLPPSGVAYNSVVSQQLRLGPISTVNTASTSAPVPRFLQSGTAGDCTVVGDCNSGFIPRLRVNAPLPLNYEGVQGGSHVIRYINILNDGVGRMDWTVTVQYRNGSNWLRPDFTSGSNGLQMRVDALPGNLAPGLYEATLVIDAGVAGRQTLPVTLLVQAGQQTPQQPPPQQQNRPAVSSALNAATFADGAFVRGSLATIMGSFAGRERTVTFDGVAGRIFYQDEKQLNVMVPAELGPRATAQVVVTVDGVPSTPKTVNLTDAAPGIFRGGILNEDGSVNTAEKAAVPGTVLQMFVTGLLPPEGGSVEVKLHDVVIGELDYAGAAPGLAGVQQVNVRVPEHLAAMTTEVLVCNTTNGRRACSAPVAVHLRR